MTTPTGPSTFPRRALTGHGSVAAAVGGGSAARSATDPKTPTDAHRPPTDETLSGTRVGVGYPADGCSG